MKKLLLLFMAFFFLTSCTGGEQAEEDKWTGIVRANGFSTSEGHYYMDNHGFMRYFDFEKRETFHACSKKNCKHLSWDENTPLEERCPAYLGRSFIGTSYGDKIYMAIPIGEEMGKSRLISCDHDLSNRKELMKFDGDYVNKMLIKDGKAYFFASTFIYEKDSEGNEVPSGRADNYFYKFDFKDQKLESQKLDLAGYSQYAGLLSYDDKAIYLFCSWFDEKLSPDNIDTIRENKKCLTYDFEKGSFQELEEARGRDIIMIYSGDRGLTFLEDLKDGNYRLSLEKGGEALLQKDLKISYSDYGSVNLITDYHGDFFYQDLEGTSHKLDMNSLEEEDYPHKLEDNFFYPIGGGYYYLVREEGGSWSSNFIKAEDFDSGKVEGMVKAY